MKLMTRHMRSVTDKIMYVPGPRLENWPNAWLSTHVWYRIAGNRLSGDKGLGQFHHLMMHLGVCNEEHVAQTE
jgi:hypothetical protein